MQALAAKAATIREHDQAIQKAQKSSMSAALAAGRMLLSGKADLKRLGIKKKFQLWIEADCKVEYKRGYNYMKLAQAAEKDPTIKDLGLTEAYLKLRLVTRKAKATQDEPATGTSGNAAAADRDAARAENLPPDNGIPASDNSGSAPVKRRRLGDFEIERRNDVYVLEIDTATDWQDALVTVLTDAENFTAVLAEGGLLLKAKE